MRLRALLNCRIDIFGPLDSFGRQFKCPRNHECDRESDHNDQHDKAHRPIRNFEEGENLGCDLNEQPSHDRVSNRHFVNVAPLQLGEEIAPVHRLLVNRFWLWTGENLLKTRIVAQWIPLPTQTQIILCDAAVRVVDRAGRREQALKQRQS